MQVITQELFSSSYFNRIADYYPNILGVFNFDTLQYQSISKNVKSILGYTQEEFLNGGLNFGYSIMNPVHAEIIANHIYPVFLEHCVKFSGNEAIKKFRFSYEYSIITKVGKPLWCLHQCTIIDIDANGHPHLDLFSITDINEIKKDDIINFSIAQKNEDDFFETFYTTGFQTRDFSLLSSREMQILRLLCEGNSTPKIASILHLSEHTVKTHRKNILQKMEVKNTMDIVKIAYDKGLL